MFKVLIVEDEKMTAETDAAKLRSKDLEVKIVNNGDDAIPTMKEWLPDVVILDLKLPGKTGVLIAKEMRRDPILRAIPKIANSGDMEPGNSLGQWYFGDAVLTEGQEPSIMIDKSKPREGMVNDLVAAVGITLWERYHRIPKKMVQYLNELNKDRKDWEVIRPSD